MINCLTHIGMAIRKKGYNPGLVMASVQLIISIIAGVMISQSGLPHLIWWWSGAVVFSIIVHVLLFKGILANN